MNGGFFSRIEVNGLSRSIAKFAQTSVLFLKLLYIGTLHRGGPSARGQWAGSLRAAIPTPLSGFPTVGA
jgi:hypothetical protein